MVSAIPESFTSSIALSTGAFLIATWLLFHYALFQLSLSKATKWKYSISILAILIAWFFLVYYPSQARFFRIDPLLAPNIMLGFLALFILLKKLYESQIMKKIITAIPNAWLIAIQTYRIVGVGFLALYAQGLLPAAFAFPSGFGDILVGVTAPFVAIWYHFKKPSSILVAKTWNYLGIADLIMALSLGILGFPVPFQTLPVTPTTELMSLFPLTIITLFAVPLALFMHCISLKILNQQETTLQSTLKKKRGR